MLRFLEIKRLEARRAELVGQSGILRQTLAVEASNLRVATAVWRQRFGFVKSFGKMLRMGMFAAGLAGSLTRARGGSAEDRGGKIPGVLRMGLRLISIFGKLKAAVFEQQRDGAGDGEF